MNRTHTAAVLAGLLLTATACSSEPSYDQTADQCIAAVKARPKDTPARPRPKVCERLTEEDYNTIVVGRVMEDLGWTGEDGRLDPNKLISPSP
ncbi:hypothetical protein [Streptomyces sp. NPDC090022]|uniref:hypothetical protein n=1 Tax=Streptomyces sp. NPDC090022 TaxID=3365920 RepID=UPI0037F125C9